MQLNSVFREWLHRRKITDNVIKEFGIHGEKELVIPIRTSDGLFTFNKYRRSPLSEEGPKYWYDKGGRVTLFAAHTIGTADTVIVTEGEMDALVCRSHNITAISSTGGAMSFQEEWFSTLKGKKIIVCFDNDTTGGNGMARMWHMNKSLWFIFLPDRPGVKDISDYVTNGGDLHELLKTAQQFKDDDSVHNDRSARIALWKNVYFHDAILKEAEIKVSSITRKAVSKRMGTDIEKARQYPLDSLLEFRKGFTKCLWHNEDHASLFYIIKKNKVFCYGQCKKSFDPIDVYRQLHNCSFTDAVSALQ